MFKLHDLLLDLTISIAKQGQFAFDVEEVISKGSTVRGFLMGKKSLGDGDVNVMAGNRAYSASCVRTLSFSQNRAIENIPEKLLIGAKELRALDLSGTRISSLPVCVGDLKLLSVLNLRGTNIKEVPECVKNNKRLRFLDISECRIQRFPQWIGELNCLEHLNLCQRFYNEFIGFMPRGISKLVSLQVLKLDSSNKLATEGDDFLRLEDFVDLISLREVRINIHHEAELKSVEDGVLASLVKMRNLTISNYCDEDNLPRLSDKMLAMTDLEYLFLSGFAVLTWICGFSNLMQIELSFCHCSEYPALETMPHLIKLSLYVDSICKAFPKEFGKIQGFPKLRSFNIFDFSLLEELPELEDGAMPHLEILQVELCPNLKKVPRGLELLKSLQKCSFLETGVTHMFEEGAELRAKIKALNPGILIQP